jgi:hypothetical protein
MFQKLSDYWFRVEELKTPELFDADRLFSYDWYYV